MDIDDIEYRPVSGPSSTGPAAYGGFEVRNKHTGSKFRPSISYGAERLRYYSFRIVLPGSGRVLSGSFGEQTSTPIALPPGSPLDLQERVRHLPAARQLCFYKKITDFQIDEGPGPDQWDAEDRDEILAEMLFFYNAKRLAENDHNERKLQRLYPEAYARKKASKVESSPMPPGITDFQPACCPALYARFMNTKDGDYVWFNE